MSKLLTLFATCFILLISSGHSQTSKVYKDTMNVTDFWHLVIEGNGDSIVKLEHIFVTTNSREEQDHLSTYLSNPRTVEHAIEVRDIFFQGFFYDFFNDYYSGAFIIDSTLFKKEVSIDIKNSQGLLFQNCVFEDHSSLKTDGWQGLTVRDTKFLNGMSLLNNRTELDGRIRMENITVIQKLANAWILINGGLYMKNCHFLPKAGTQPGDSIHLEIGGEISNLELVSDTFNIPVIFGYNAKITNAARVSDCYFDIFSIEGLTLPENQYNTYIKWSQIRDHLAFHRGYFTKIAKSKFKGAMRRRTNYYTFNTDSSIISEYYFDKLISNANQLYSIYKTQGDIQSSNQCYADIKKFETKRWKQLYEQNNSFESFFRWQLNKFLSYFTDYGTNPAKAVIKSAWVVILFSIFYLFFPSDWDVSNRSQLLAKTKELFNKNRETTFSWTLGFIAYSAFVHVLNALTLSLNAFTTLGFGDIPTHGAARYVTIVQGFIGWFLLTIFSVSLINQVLG